jgi:hypothetical protein
MFYVDVAVGTETAFGVTEAFRAPVHLKTGPSSKYGGSGATLTDGILGGLSFTNGTNTGGCQRIPGSSLMKSRFNDRAAT